MTFHRMTPTTSGGDGHDGDRIDHRRLDLTFELDRLLDVGRQPLENGVENAARLAGGDHVGKERVEGLRMLLHRVGQRRAAFDVGPGLQDHRREILVVFLVAEDVETLHERQAGVDHHRELPREHREVLGRRGFGLGFLRGRGGLGLRGANLGDEDLLAAERRDHGVHGVADPLAADRLTAAGASRECKGRHGSSSLTSSPDALAERRSGPVPRPARRRRRG